MGAAPPSMAKAASVRQRPGWDQAHQTMAATIGPTPVGVSRSGPQARTRVVMARVCSAISVFRRWMRRAKARRLAAVAAVSGSRSARWRSRPQVATRRGVVRSRSRPERIRSGDDQGLQLALGVGGGLDRRTPGGQPHRQRRPLTGGPWLGEAVAAQGLTGRPGGVQRVGRGAVAAGGPLGRSSSTTCSAWAWRTGSGRPYPLRASGTTAVTSGRATPQFSSSPLCTTGPWTTPVLSRTEVVAWKSIHSWPVRAQHRAHTLGVGRGLQGFRHVVPDPRCRQASSRRRG
jgi:hypothetical protein